MTEGREPVELDVSVVVPTIGRPSLTRLLDSLAANDGPTVREVLLVDDRRQRAAPLLGTSHHHEQPDTPEPTRSTGVGTGRRPADLRPRASWLDSWLAERTKVITGRALGPAGARNDGWRAASSEWVAFLDDDVEVPPDWLRALAHDLAEAEATPWVGGSQGRIHVPVSGPRPTDWERNVRGLEQARWATADMAYRRRVLAAVGGFDERFPRAYREDADLGLRVVGSGWAIVQGARRVHHPVPPVGWSVSLTKQAGNADDPVMDRLHGAGWRERAGAPQGRRPVHLLTVGCAAAALVGAATGKGRAAAAGAIGWLGLTAEFAVRRLRPGPVQPTEISTVVATSALIPPLATFHWVSGLMRARRLVPTATRPPVEAVLFDRDGTLVLDVPYNGDPERVVPAPGAVEALRRLRAAGLRIGMVSNQSGVAKGLIDVGQVDAVNARVQELLGPLDAVVYCPHDADHRCTCRKPAPGMVVEAAAALRVAPERVAVVGDIGTDVAAATAAGARGILVPTEVTRIEEIDECPEVVAHLGAAVDLLLATGTPR